MIDIKDIHDNINNLPANAKTKELDELIKSYYGLNEPVSFDAELIKNNVWLAKAFFFINAKYLKDPKEIFLFIDKYIDVFYYWYSTDSIIKLVKKCDPAFMLEYAKKYVNSEDTYTRRWGYVMFVFHPIRKDRDFVKSFLPLFKNDEEETNQMGQAWMLCEFAVFNPDMIYDYLIQKKLNYRITSKTISKITDSFRISDEWKNKFRSIRSLYYGE